MNRQTDLAKIHLAKRELGLNEAAYRALLARVSGLDSAAQLDAAGRRRVLAELRRLGWRPMATAVSGQARLIRVLWLRLHRAGAVHERSEQAMNAFARRLTGVGEVRRLNSRQANTVIEALKAWLARVAP